MRARARNASLGTIAVGLALTVGALLAEPPASTAPASRPADVVEAARAAAQSGQLLYRLSTPDEVKALLGPPGKETKQNDGDGQVLMLEYPDVRAIFRKLNPTSPFTLWMVKVEANPLKRLFGGEALDIGMNRTITLRNLDDLAKLDTFWGVANVSLVKVDLTGQMPRLNKLPFDSRTQWPAADKLPKGFDPTRLLEDGKNPGLGVRKLHEQGLDGRGVHIAIIDQPLLRNHREYKDRVVQYEPIEVSAVPPQMHGSPVTSIAVGKTCGTAPAAFVHYYAVPTWKWWNEHCKPYAATVDRIVADNQKRPADQKVRVISISLGAFSQWPDHTLWVKAVKHAADEGVLVVSCDPADYRITILKRNPAKDPDLPHSYARQFMFSAGGGLGVPAGNRTTAAHTGPDDYVFWRDGGMSWTVPYLAGLAALAFQVNPEIKPQAIPEFWTKTAAKTSAGQVVNPAAFIEAVKGERELRREGRTWGPRMTQSL
jgi:hypothetical protein